MNIQRLLLIILLSSLIVISKLPYQSAAQVKSYSEEIKIYTAGTSALWLISIDRVNITDTNLLRIKNYTSVTSYTLTAIKAVNWQVDFQVFGPDGYNVLHLPFIPDQGVFLSVNSSTYSSALSVAKAFDEYMYLSFSSLSNSSNGYTFFSPLEFDTIVQGTLLKILPKNGFASLVSESQFTGLETPVVILHGARSSAGFTNTLSIGSIKSNAVDSLGRIAFPSIFGSNIKFVRSSPLSNASLIKIFSLDGQIFTRDNATVINHANLSGSYLLKIGANQTISRLNLTLLQQPPIVIGKRLIDRGALGKSDLLSVTLSVKNIGSFTVNNFTVDDNWWRSYGYFSLAQNTSSSIMISSIKPNEEVSRSYVLKVNSNVTDEITIPKVIGHYLYKVDGGTYTASTVFNEASLLIGKGGPALIAYIMPEGSSGKPIGSNENFTITVVNLGNAPALDVNVAGKSNPTLAQGGQSWVFSLPISANNLTNRNVSRIFTVTWRTPSGETMSINTNLAKFLFSHSSMQLGLARFTLNGALSFISPSEKNLTLTLSVANRGRANVSSFDSTFLLPPWLICSNFSSNGVRCDGNEVKLSYKDLKPNSQQSSSLSFKINKSENIMIGPFKYEFTTSNITFKGFTGAFAAPLGLSIVKEYVPSNLFQGMIANVNIRVSNLDMHSFYNVSINANADPFDSVIDATKMRASYGKINGHESFNFNYSVLLSMNQFGNKIPSPTSVHLIFGGMSFDLNIPAPKLIIYKTVFASISTLPQSPVEGEAFLTELRIINPSPVNLQDIHLEFILPVGIDVLNYTNASVENGKIVIDVNSLQSNGTYTSRLWMKGGPGAILTLQSARLSFNYHGSTVNGMLPKFEVVIGENIIDRYIIPISISLLAVIAAVALLRRKLTSPSSLI